MRLRTQSGRLVADIVVDDEDFGGVAICLPAQLRLNSALCSFLKDPERQDIASASNYVTVWQTTDDALPYTTMVEVARVRESPYTPTGGSGTLVLHMSLDESALEEEIDSLGFCFELGASDQGSYISWGTTYETVSVSLP